LLLASGTARRCVFQHTLANRLGIARLDGGGRSRASGGGAWRRLPDRQPGRGWQLGRAVVHGGRFSARLLSEIPRLPGIFPALGAGPLSPPVAGKLAAGLVRPLTGDAIENVPRPFVSSQASGGPVGVHDCRFASTFTLFEDWALKIP